MKNPKKPASTPGAAAKTPQKGFYGAGNRVFEALARWIEQRGETRPKPRDAPEGLAGIAGKSGPDHNGCPADQAYRRRPRLPSPLAGAIPWDSSSEAHLRNKVESTLMGSRHWTKDLESILKKLAERPSSPGRSSLENWVNGLGRESNGRMQGRDTALLSYAVDSASPAIARFLMEFGCDPRVVNSDGTGPMFQCVSVADRIRDSLDPERARKDCEGVVAALLEFGGNPNEQWTRTEPRDASSLLARVGRTRQSWLMGALLAAGARADHPGADGQPLLCDLAEDCPEMIPFFEKLAAVGARVNGRGDNSMTPFLIAVHWRNKAAIEALVRLGAEREARDSGGRGWRELLANPPNQLWSPERRPIGDIHAWLESLELQDELKKGTRLKKAASATPEGQKDSAAEHLAQKDDRAESAARDALEAAGAASDTPQATGAITAKRKSRRL